MNGRFGASGGAGRWLIVGVLAVAVAAAAFALVQRRRAPELKRTLVERVVEGRFSREVSGTGVIGARTERALSFKTSGTVAELFVTEGDEVAAGTPLARLDTAALERDLASSRASLQSARADSARLSAQQGVDRIDTESALAGAQDSLASAQEALDNAQRSLATTERLFETGAASQNELTSARETFASAERRLANARLSLQSAEARQASFDDLAAAQRSSVEAQIAQFETAIANLEQSLSEASLSAPFAGTVATVGFKVGDTVSGAGQGQTLQLVDTSSLYVEAQFDENRAAELQAGQSATVTPDADANRQLAATVERVGTVANRNAGAAQLEADLRFAEGEAATGAVRPGYTVTVRTEVNALEDVLLIPLEAVTEADGSSFVYRVSESEPGEGSLERASLEILDRNATVAAAKSSELAAGDLIAVINLDELEAGDLVSYDPLEGGAGGS